MTEQQELVFLIVLQHKGKAYLLLHQYSHAIVRYGSYKAAAEYLAGWTRLRREEMKPFIIAHPSKVTSQQLLFYLRGEELPRKVVVISTAAITGMAVLEVNLKCCRKFEVNREQNV